MPGAVILPAWQPPWLPATALALLLLALIVIVIWRLRAPPSTPAAPLLAATTTTAAALTSWIAQALERLMSLVAAWRGFGSVPILIAIGAGSDEVAALLPSSGQGPADLVRAQRDLFRGQCRLSVCPEGAVVSFDDGLLGSDAWETRWNEFVAALLAYRDDRPFDGLVIVLPAERLVGAKALYDADLLSLGERICQLIWSAQRAGGWRVPIHLVLSGCEILTGFEATAIALPARTRQAPCGWTAPYALDAAFEPRWIQEGVDALAGRLSRLQSTLLQTPREPAAAEQILLFPRAVAALGAPLTMLLKTALRPSAYYEAFMFRGFYLTGRAAGDGPSEETRNLFADRVFVDRIFPEHVLARPAAGSTTRRQRRVRFAQAAVLALALLGTFGLARVAARGEAVPPVRKLMAEILSMVAQRDHGAPSGGDNDFAATVQQLHDMGTISLNRLETRWAPLSFLSNASGTVIAAIQAGYQVNVLKTIRHQLTDTIPGLLGASELAKPGLDCPPDPARASAMLDLAGILTKTEEYRRQLGLFQSLSADPSIDSLTEVIGYALHQQMPAEFRTRYDLYVAALRGVDASLSTQAMETIYNSVKKILMRQFLSAFDESYRHSELACQVDFLVSTAERMTSSAEPEPSLVRLRQLDTILPRIGALAPQPAYDWLAQDKSSQAIADALDRAARLAQSSAKPNDIALLKDGFVKSLNERAQALEHAERQRLLDAKAFGDAPVLAIKEGRAQLAPGLAQIATTVHDFLQLPLIVAPSTAAREIAERQGRLVWNVQELRRLQSLVESYSDFATKNLPALPGDLRWRAASVAAARIDRIVDAAVAQAVEQGAASASPAGSAAALHEEIGGFAEATPVLDKVRLALRGAGNGVAADRLSRIVFGQAIRMLRQVDGLLTAADPYQLVDHSLSFWSGSPPLAAPAFGARSLADLTSTLPARRDFVDTLAREYAAPLVSYLQQEKALTASDRALAARWKANLDTLDRYRRGDAINTLSRLEQFITVEMDRIDLANCPELIGGPVGGTDWFGEQLQRLRGAVAARCGGAVGDVASGLYHEVAEAFDRDLAGRFPFGGLAAPDADPADVKRFFTRFGADLPLLRDRLAPGGVMQRFVGQLLDVQSVLAPMLVNPAPDAPLSYDVTPEFRTNAGSDPGADQIVEVTLQFGRERLSSFAAATSIAWSNGQTARVALRWAAEAPSMPEDLGAEWPRVRDRTATFEYAGAWSLLRLIASQRPRPSIFAQLSDRRPETVGFVVRLRRNPQAAQGGDSELTTAQAFMRLGLTATVSAPGQPPQRKAVALPSFPFVAPAPALSSRRPSRVSSAKSPLR